MRIKYKNTFYKFNKYKLLNNLINLIIITAMIILYGIAGASDHALGI